MRIPSLLAGIVLGSILLGPAGAQDTQPGAARSGLELAQGKKPQPAQPGQVNVVPIRPLPILPLPSGEKEGAPKKPAGEEGAQAEAHGGEAQGGKPFDPPVWSMLFFVLMLLSIAVLPLVREHWWENNWNKLKVSLVLGIPVILYLWGWGGHDGVHHLLHEAEEYFSFIVLLSSLYIISGGIVLRGDIEARPSINTAFLAIGGLLASLMGTTGAAMVLIRPLLRTNSERKHVMHTVIFFTFIVANIGGSLTPLGDPPLFMGYLRGVPFTWTLHLLPHWGFAVGVLLVVYYIFDTIQYKKETKKAIRLDETQIQPLQLVGKINFLFLLGVVLSVAFINPLSLGEKWAYLQEKWYLREIVMILLTLLSLRFTSKALRKENKFTYAGIVEVAFLFLGIFATMVPALMWLHLHGGEFGVSRPWHFFWMTGGLSSFLDNTPTYVVYFSLAGSPELAPTLVSAYGAPPASLSHVGIPQIILEAISVGAVFMGANTYIGNAPNFMVKVIAEERKIKMPSFFGYMLWSGLILVPLFVIITFIWFL